MPNTMEPKNRSIAIRGGGGRNKWNQAKEYDCQNCFTNAL